METAEETKKEEKSAIGVMGRLGTLRPMEDYNGKMSQGA